jgi:hypothetical protein
VESVRASFNSLFPENRIVPVTRGIFFLKLVDQSNIDKLIDNIKEEIKSGYADGAVNVAIFIAYGDLHPLGTHGFFTPIFQRELTRDLPVELSYLLAFEDGSLHAIAPEKMHYVGKYVEKEGSVTA